MTTTSPQTLNIIENLWRYLKNARHARRFSCIYSMFEKNISEVEVFYQEELKDS